MGRAFVVLVACVVVLLAGCTVEGQPSAAEPAQPEPTGLQLPQRPREVRIDGVDPCSLLTEGQRAELGFGDRATGSLDTSSVYNATVPSCLFEGTAPRHTNVGVTVVTSAGVERYARADVDADLQQTTVQGFPALVVVPRRYDDYCVLVVDAAPGQLVEVQYGDVALPPPIPQDELCRNAEQVADSVMATLLAL